jgi:hypothetical protein
MHHQITCYPSPRAPSNIFGPGPATSPVPPKFWYCRYSALKTPKILVLGRLSQPVVFEFGTPRFKCRLPNLDIKCGSCSAGEPKMGTILRRGDQMSVENNALIIFERKNSSHLVFLQ